MLSGISYVLYISHMQNPQYGTFISVGIPRHGDHLNTKDHLPEFVNVFNG